MNKYLKLKESLETYGKGEMTCFGNSMLPILKSGSTLIFEKRDNYQIQDIVFCKVKGRFIDAHKIVKIDSVRGYQIANNHGFINGWTHTIFGKAVQVKHQNTIKNL